MTQKINKNSNYYWRDFIQKSFKIILHLQRHQQHRLFFAAAFLLTLQNLVEISKFNDGQFSNTPLAVVDIENTGMPTGMLRNLNHRVLGRIQHLIPNA